MFPAEENLPREILSWEDIDRVIDHLLLQFNHEYEGLVMITRGGLFPGGMLCEAMDIHNIHTAAVHIAETPTGKMAWPTFMQFPVDTLVTGRRLLVVDDLWADGVNIIAVKSRLEAAGAMVETAVLHYRPKSSLFPDSGPDYYGAITDRYIIYPWSLAAQMPPGYFNRPPRPPFDPAPFA